MAGRKPKPTALKLVQGTFQPCRSARNEPKPKPEIPSCPEQLQGLAREEWGRISEELYSMGLLTRIDRAALAGYCEHFAVWAEASKKVRELGVLVKAKNGFPMQSPYLSIMNRALAEMRKFLVEFGMTPSSRSRVSAAKPSDPSKTGWEELAQ